jgi:streptogramin lyase
LERKVASLLIVITLLISLFTILPSIPVQAQPTLKTLNLPTNYIPIGIVYDGTYIWTVSYTYGAISKIDLSTSTVTHYYVKGSPDTNYDWCFYGLRIDVNGNFWISCRSGYLVKFYPSTGSFEVKGNFVYLESLHYYNGYVYFASGSNLYKYNITTDTYETFAIPNSSYGYFFGATDTSGNIWFSDIINGYVYKFDGATITQYSGFHRPLGITYTNNYIYVAENVRQSDIESNPTWQPAIARLNPSNGSIVRTVVTGSPYGLATFTFLGSTYLAWSSSGEDSTSTKGIGLYKINTDGSLTNVIFFPTSLAIYYIQYNNNVIYFTFYGSNGVGAMENVVEPTKTIIRYPFELKIWYPKSVKKGEEYSVHIELKNIGDKTINNVVVRINSNPIVYSENIGALEPNQVYSKDFTKVINRYWNNWSVRAYGWYEFTRYWHGREYTYSRMVTITTTFRVMMIR